MAASAHRMRSWARGWAVHVMAHVYAARAVLAGHDRTARMAGCSTRYRPPGLLSQIGAAVYGTTKHAAIGFAESVAIAHKDHGIGVSVLCPHRVSPHPWSPGDFVFRRGRGWRAHGQMRSSRMPRWKGSAKENRFLILPHPCGRRLHEAEGRRITTAGSAAWQSCADGWQLRAPDAPINATMSLRQKLPSTEAAVTGDSCRYRQPLPESTYLVSSDSAL